jgi:tellurite resistance protein TerC
MGLLVLVLAADLFLAVKRPHVPSARESAIWVAVYVTLALLFALAMLLVGGAEHAGQFIAGWLTEYSLSIDNLFVFVLIMARFSVPVKNQQEVLMVGIVIALVFRGIFIVLGAALIASFGWIFYFFGAFLIYTAVRQATGQESRAGQQDGAFLRFVKRSLNFTDEFDGMKFRSTVGGKRVLTPLLLVLLALGTTDVLFALDSIPAIFGITSSPFIVFAANIFALMGLRQLYFLLGHLLERLVYLTYGIAVILAFIGVKLVFHALHENNVPFINGGHPVEWAPDFGTLVSLGVIVVSMAAATVASLVRSSRGARLTGPRRGR